jgi:hypothetical protein
MIANDELSGGGELEGSGLDVIEAKSLVFVCRD